jgi:hypothetical protein
MKIGRQVPEWELKLELSSSSGSKLADLYLLRERASDPVLVDMSLLGGEFRTAVSGAVDRTISRVLVADGIQEITEGVLPAKAASGGILSQPVFALAGNSASSGFKTRQDASRNS